MANAKPLVALQEVGMKEFDPECERHWPLLIIKKVDPGCTEELQIENAETGEVVRITTTDNPAADMIKFETAILEQFRKACLLPE